MYGLLSQSASLTASRCLAQKTRTLRSPLRGGGGATKRAVHQALRLLLLPCCRRARVYLVSLGDFCQCQLCNYCTELCTRFNPNINWVYSVLRASKGRWEQDAKNANFLHSMAFLRRSLDLPNASSQAERSARLAAELRSSRCAKLAECRPESSTACSGAMLEGLDDPRKKRRDAYGDEIKCKEGELKRSRAPISLTVLRDTRN